MILRNPQSELVAVCDILTPKNAKPHTMEFHFIGLLTNYLKKRMISMF